MKFVILFTLAFLILVNYCYAQQKDKTNNVCQRSLENLVAENSFIFEAEIIKVYPSTYFWSESAVFNYQKVKYKISKTIKGDPDAKEIIVSHALIKGSPFADEKIPQLSPSYFSEGKKLILFVDKLDSRVRPTEQGVSEFFVTDSDCSVMPDDEDKMNSIIKIAKQ